MSSDGKRPVWEEWLDVGYDVGLHNMRNSAYVKYSVGDGENLKHHQLQQQQHLTSGTIKEFPRLH